MHTPAAIENVKGESSHSAGDANPASRSQPIPRFQSILSEFSGSEVVTEAAQQPEFFRDLNLDQIVDAITAGRDEYNLKPFFYSPLTSLTAIGYRHEIMRDLERDALFQSIKSFSIQMHAMRVRLDASEKSYYRYQKKALFLEAAETYCGAVETLLRNLGEHEPASRGLLAFRKFLVGYATSAALQALADEANAARSGLSAIRYAVLIKGSSITVRNYDAEPDYTAAVEKTFAKFKRGAVNDYLVKFSESSGLNHVENMVLERVALLNPEAFGALDDFRAKHEGFVSQTISDFASRFERDQSDGVLSLRAERQSDGPRTFKLLTGVPLETSYGEDLYEKIFGGAAERF
jgi:DNA mismatch repair protein MutS